MTVYAVHVQIRTHAGPGWAGSRAVPTFYLDSRVQGITGPEHAAAIAAQVVNPLRLIPADDLQVGAYAIDPARENRELDDFAAEQSMGRGACGDGGHAVTCTPAAHTDSRLADGTPAADWYASWSV